MQDSSNISNTTAIETHLHNLLFDSRCASWVGGVEHKSSSLTALRATEEALFTLCCFAVFDDVFISLAMGTDDWNQCHRCEIGGIVADATSLQHAQQM